MRNEKAYSQTRRTAPTMHHAQSVVEKGFAAVPDWLGLDEGCTSISPRQIAAFQQLWWDLDDDAYMKAEDRGSRERRYGTARVLLPNAPDDVAQILPVNNNCFAQPHNRYSSQKRNFSPAPPTLYSNPVFVAIVTGTTDILATLHPDVREWNLGIHLIRIRAGRNVVGKPAPEGRHKDGHEYVAQVLIHRDPVLQGGTSLVYDEDGKLTLAHTMQKALEGILVDDGRVFHDVVPVFATREAYRDMLLLDFNSDFAGVANGK